MFQLELSPFLQGYFSQDARGFDALMEVEGEVYREVKGRRTVAFERGGRRFFIKAHRGYALKEIFKSLTSFTVPVLGAQREWRAAERLEQLGIRTFTVAGKGRRGMFPGSRGSFVITEALDGLVSLEDLLERQDAWPKAQRDRLKRHAIERLAALSRKLHEGGVNHRDYYICHFLVKDRDWAHWSADDPLEPVLIDLHRVQMRSCVPDRWRVKDLGALMYSSFAADLTVQDAMRFIRGYLGGGPGWKETYRSQKRFWHRVVARALGFQREWNVYLAKEARNRGELAGRSDA